MLEARSPDTIAGLANFSRESIEPSVSATKARDHLLRSGNNPVPPVAHRRTPACDIPSSVDELMKSLEHPRKPKTNS